MSEFRRKLLILSTDNSWFRICNGGIYTINDAYINTGYTNFTNRYFEYYIDCKVLTESETGRILCGAAGNGSYNSASFIGTTGTDTQTWYPNVFRGTRHQKRSDITNWNNIKPFIGKKVRYNQPINYNNYKCSIQFFIGQELGGHTYSNYEKIERYNYTCNSPIYIFSMSVAGVKIGSANNIVIYKTEAKNQGNIVYSFTTCQLTKNIPGDLSWDNKPHYSGEYGMFDEVSGKFFGNANSSGYFIENFD